MIILTSSKVSIQASEQSVPRVPGWFGEVTVIAQYLGHLGVLADISERVRFTRRRFGHYDLIVFVVVLLGYAISGERTLEAFKEETMTSEVNKHNDEIAIKRVSWLLRMSVPKKSFNDGSTRPHSSPPSDQTHDDYVSCIQVSFIQFPTFLSIPETQKERARPHIPQFD